MELIDAVKFNDKGLVTVIAQDFESNEVLMVAYMNKDTLTETIEKASWSITADHGRKDGSKVKRPDMFRRSVRCILTVMVMHCFLKLYNRVLHAMRIISAVFFVKMN